MPTVACPSPCRVAVAALAFAGAASVLGCGARARVPAFGRPLASTHVGALEQLTGSSDDETSPAISPDGTTLIYASDGDVRIMVLAPHARFDATKGNPDEDLDAAVDLPEPPFFYGDAQSILYRGRAGTHDVLYRVVQGGANGATERVTLPPSVRAMPQLRIESPACSFDGTHIVASVASERDELVRLGDVGRGSRARPFGPLPNLLGGPYGGAGFNEVGVEITRTPSQIVAFSKSGREQWLGEGVAPSMSPDGHSVAFVSTAEGTRRAVLASTLAGAPADLHPLVDGLPLSNPTFSPDGAWVAITLRAEEAGVSTARLVIVRTDGSALRDIATSGSAIRDLVWGRDGWIYFAANARGNYDVYRIDPSR